jgi:lipopolysaccharide/colanic/teichoic acid biosynthesis glycosyltransferase
MLEFVLALVILVCSAPIMAIAVILVKISSRGPAIYTQRRLGKGGKIFTIYKIRTMYLDSERHSGPMWSVPGDPRVTPVGRILRACHVDELPQVLNVLLGEMSLVGPRPERPELAAKLERDIARYSLRLAVRPGVTGLAQVQRPPDTDVAGVRRKLDYDLLYVERMSPWLDVRLIAATVFKCLGVSFCSIRWIMQLPAPDAHFDRETVVKGTERTVQSLV